MNDHKEWIDISRGIAIILVVIGHSLQTFDLALGYNPDPSLNTAIYSFHMPFFFLLSGYLFKYRNRSEMKFLRYGLRNFQRLVLPCLGTLIVILIYEYLISSNVQKSAVGTSAVRELVVVSLYGNGKPLPFSGKIGITSPSWFLLCLCAANLVFWVLMKATENRGILVRGAVIIGTSCLGVFVGERKIYLPWSLDIALASQIFLYVGYLISTVNLSGKKNVLHLGIILICLGISVLSIRMGGISMNEREYNNFAISASGGIAGSVLLLYFSHMLGRLSIPVSGVIFYFSASLIKNVTSVISWLGRESLMIYCLNVLDFCFFRFFYLQTEFVQLLFANWAILALFRLFYCLIIIDMIRRVPFLRSLFYWREYPIVISRPSAPDKTI